MDILAPHDEDEIVECVLAALDKEIPLDIIGGNSRDGLGRAQQSKLRLSTTNLSGISYYEPSELVLTAFAGTPVSQITKLLDQHNQELAFEPIGHCTLYNHSDRTSTLGGLIAVNASGPRRIKVGAARDHLLGFRAINGRGEVFQSGGKVMKNVTGYDMCKLMTGSYGTLGVFSEITMKVMPKAECENTLFTIGLDEKTAVEAMTYVSGLPQETSGLAHLPMVTGKYISPAPSKLRDNALTGFRIEGSKKSVETRCKELKSILSEYGKNCDVITGNASRKFWANLRDVSLFSSTNNQIWRISTAPTQGALLVSDLISRDVPVEAHYYDWAGGLIWLAIAPEPHAHAATIREVVDVHGGHATLVCAGEEVRSTVHIFHPQSSALAALTRRIRLSFDPQLIFNRGRLGDEI